MSMKLCAMLVLLIGTLCINLSQEKPTAVLNRCMCRGGATQINVRNIKGLQLIPIPNCPLQLIATLKTGRKICLHSKFLNLWRKKVNRQSKM
ncbi:stromal cell-derived factor 1-like isoform X2 [Pristis pectinata]|uniref:stromal cell-derived factor 1-like isoform X2 n=1 Tax=Pristis pectinata TaxID=685728 RepID=UPI00223E37B7|nr:stromal cell-derived factor 1-like isoform X2 [Pristis pectinata]